MKAVISKEELVSLIGKIQNIVSTKPAIPVLSNILIEATDDQLILSSTDLTTSMRSFTEAKVIEEGAIALPARRFFQLIRELTSPQVKISCTSPEKAEIVSGSSLFKLNGVNKDEFPTLPDFANAKQLQLTQSFLKEILSRTAFSAARDDSRYVLNSLLVQIYNQQATFTGTDGKRLAKVVTKIDLDTYFQGNYILPLKAVEEMIKMLDESIEKACLGLLHDKIFLEHGNTILITKLLAGQYPDIERVIPKSSRINIILHREELISLLKQVSLFTSESTGSVRFIFDEGQLELKAVNSDLGEGTVSMPVDYHEQRLEIAFNPFFFLDILRHSKDETVSFAINDAYNPGIVTDSSSALFVIMPMRLNNPPTFSPPGSIDDVEKPVFA